jgi:hypothetical protein
MVAICIKYTSFVGLNILRIKINLVHKMVL